MSREDKRVYSTVGLIMLAYALTFAWFAKQMYADAQTTQPAMPTTRTMSLGINIDVNDNNVEPGIWSDVARGFSNWYTNANVNATGYPTNNGAQCQSTLIGCPPGAYTVTFDGTAVLSPGFGPTLTNVARNGATTTATLNVPRANCLMMFTVSGLVAADPFRNMHIYVPGAGPTSPAFRPEWTKWFQPFTVVRAIDWTANVNLPAFNPNPPAGTQNPTTQPVTWSTRNQPTNWDQVSPGHRVAHEYFLALAEQTGMIPWINVPLMADDDYCWQYAKLVAAYNFPVIYVELGNEDWNWGFGQRWQLDQLANVPPNLSVDGNIVNGLIVPGTSGPVTNSNTRAARFAAEKARRMGLIFRAVLGTNRVRVVLAGQHMNPQWLTDEAQWIQAKYGDVTQVFSCFAIAPYAPINQPSSPGATLQSIAAANLGYINGDCAAFIAAHAKLASQYSEPLVAYEFGQNYYPWTNPTTGANGLPTWAATDLPVTLQTDPLMGQIYASLLNVCQANGITLANHNSGIRPWARGGLFAVQQDLNDSPPAVKWTTLATFAALPSPAPIPPPPIASTQPWNLMLTIDPVKQTATPAPGATGSAK